MLLGSLGCAATATGCLVAEAPEYGPPQQRPPVVEWQQIKPTPEKVVLLNESLLSMDINVPVRSEDAGDDLLGALYLDLDWLDPGPESYVIYKPVPASSFDDLERSWTFTFVPDNGVAKRCGHLLTLLIMHESNFDYDKVAPKANASWDVASVSWRLNVYPDDANFIAICPPEGTATQ
ncbi:MAG TPA: hypothetical protein VFZ53_21540 [Polyangiaceae bacterium]